MPVVHAEWLLTWEYSFAGHLKAGAGSAVGTCDLWVMDGEAHFASVHPR